MSGMISNRGDRASLQDRPTLSAAPLAEVVCCQHIPEVEGSIEPSTEPQLRHDQVLDGRFLIRAAIGRSGMATIYRAEDMLNGRREVAIKVPLRKIESDPAHFRRFRREEEIGLKLSHPFLLKFLPVIGDKTHPYIVTEFLQGCTLTQLGSEKRPFTESDALKIVSLICEALEQMHRQGFIHCDLKPSNIMMCSDQTLRVMDFGLACPPIRQRSILAKLTSIMRSPEYMAPEQVDNGPVDERTDIYSLGAILYELLTGQVPFKNDDLWESAYQRTAGDPIAPRELNPRLSLQAEEVVLHALQRISSDRYSSMAAFKAELDEPARVPITGYAERLQSPRWKFSFQGTPLLAGWLLGFGAVLFLIILFLFLRSGYILK